MDRKRSLMKQADILYENHVRPLEAEHSGDFVAVSPDGRIILESSLLELTRKAKTDLGPGSFVFKVGERAVGRWR
jgi:hypothetical protein